MREKREKNKGERTGDWSRGNKEVLLDKEDTDMAHRQMVVYKGKKGNPHVRMRCLLLNGHLS